MRVVRTRARLGAGASHQGARDRAGHASAPASWWFRWSAPSSSRKRTRDSFRCGSTRPVGSSLEYTDSKVQQVEEALKRFPEVALVMTTVGTNDGRNYARVNLRLDGALRARAVAEGDRAGDSHRAQAHSGHRAGHRLQPAGVGQPAGTRPGDADHADQPVRAGSRQDPGYRRPRDFREGAQSGAVDSPQQRRRAPTWASTCNRSAPWCGRCSPATP